MPSVTLVGATGLTGSQALSYLLASPQNFFVKAITRRAAPQPTSPPAAPGAKYENEVVHDLWTVEDVAKQGDVYVSCLGTTRAQAGGADKQVLVDRDLNISLADKAKAQGAETVSTPSLNRLLPLAVPVISYGDEAAAQHGVGRMQLYVSRHS